MTALKVLVVDGDQFDRMLLTRYLKTIEPTSEIIEVEDGGSALALLRTTRFDCMFVDYRLPDWNGVELITSLRAQDLYTPAIVVTGQKGEEIAASAIRAGVIDLLDKTTLSMRTLTPALARVEQVIAQSAKVTAAQRALEEREAMYRALFENSLYGLLLINEAGVIIDANQVACSLLGCQQEELVGAVHSEMVLCDNPRYQIACQCGGQAKFIGELTLRRRDLSTFSAEVTSCTFTLPDGRYVTQFSLQDITDRKPA